MISTIQQHLIYHTKQAVNELYGADVPDHQITIQETRKEFEGQLTIVVFPLTRFSRKSPEATGNDIGSYLLKQLPQLTSFNTIKGFLNLTLSDAYWTSLFTTAVMHEKFGQFPANGRKVMVEYSSPNTNKPLHLGHIRNNLLGYSVASILKAYGYTVIKANLVNDRGIHICKSMLAWQRWGNGETPESSGLKGDHLVGKYYVLFDKAYKREIDELKANGYSEEVAKRQAPIIREAQQMLQQWEAGDAVVIALWKTMNSWVYAGFERTYGRLGVDFDK